MEKNEIIEGKLNLLVSKIEEMTRQNSEEHKVVCGKLERMNTALFARDDDNEFKMPGLMVIGQKMNSHIDTVCALGGFIKKAFGWLGGVASGASAVWFLGFQMGWW